MKHKGNIVILDDLSATYLHARAEGSHKTPSEIISELVREKSLLRCKMYALGKPLRGTGVKNEEVGMRNEKLGVS
jgi:hypothetical protein